MGSNVLPLAEASSLDISGYEEEADWSGAMNSSSHNTMKSIPTLPGQVTQTLIWRLDPPNLRTNIHLDTKSENCTLQKGQVYRRRIYELLFI